ncbi:uncharacterized protein N7483_005696 [Penicillium malachiteum]|uniref:uncharacterized protein n=1 Tax=Penicillium malachiteum TaxID=1324776 RepID=UPI00254894AF|nr:uncharacterized protein N7483_005696 [Penicillium malachiteum]KAJ5731188.1 hypothetical protein N7483_005696 [Penicillium malachiteum]
MSFNEHGDWSAGDRANYPKEIYNVHDELPDTKWPVVYREFPIFHPNYPRWDMPERRQGPGLARVQVPWRHPEKCVVSYHSPCGENSNDNYHNVVMAKYWSKREHDKDEFKVLFEENRHEAVLAHERARRRKARMEKARWKEAKGAELE